MLQIIIIGIILFTSILQINCSMESEVSSLKALCINSYLKNKDTHTAIDEIQKKANLTQEIKELFTYYRPLEKETVKDQIECFSRLNDTHMLKEAAAYCLTKEVSIKEKIRDILNGAPEPEFPADWKIASIRVNKDYDEWFNTIQKVPKLDFRDKKFVAIKDTAKQKYIERRQKIFNAAASCDRFCKYATIIGMPVMLGSVFLFHGIKWVYANL